MKNKESPDVELVQVETAFIKAGGMTSRIHSKYLNFFRNSMENIFHQYQNFSLLRLKRISLILFLLFFLSFIFFSGLNSRHTLMTVSRTQIASDLVMHSQRLGKAAPNAIQGNTLAFRQLEQSRNAINQELTVLSSGGEWQGRSIRSS